MGLLVRAKINKSNFKTKMKQIRLKFDENSWYVRCASTAFHPIEGGSKNFRKLLQALALQHVFAEGSHLSTALEEASLRPQIGRAVRDRTRTPRPTRQQASSRPGSTAPRAQRLPGGGAEGSARLRRHRRAPPPALLPLRGRSCWRQWIPSLDNGFP